MFVFTKDSNKYPKAVFRFVRKFGTELETQQGSSPFSVLFFGKTQALKMENASVVVIRSSEEEKGEGNGSNEKEKERGVAVKSKFDEYRQISDLTGFENLKAMILAESVMKRNRKKKKKKKDKTKIESAYRQAADLTGFDNPKAMIEAEASMRRKSRKKKRNEIKTQEDETVCVLF